jgi:hypothetical protein
MPVNRVKAPAILIAEAPAPQKIAVGSRVERINSPADSTIKNGSIGEVADVRQCDNGELGFFVRTVPGVPPAFWAATRARLAPAELIA